ncbi:MAG: FHA domain-containing protein, partial [Coriobacteriales bacterium]|nr:FHA domain-containing protein [Coriobacteriales bacterium]
DDDGFDSGLSGQGPALENRSAQTPAPAPAANMPAEDVSCESPARDAQYAKAAKSPAPASLIPETIILDRANPRGTRDVTDAASLRPAASLLNQETGEVWQLEGMRVSLGRDRNMQIPLRDANVSRSHAELIYDNGRWILRDLGSTNGSFINGQRVGQMELKDGDIIELGVTVLEFREDQL